MSWSYYPASALLHPRFGLFPGRSPLLGESLLFSSPRGTKMFQFPRFASCIKHDTIEMVGCPIRKSADQRSFAPSRGLSQLITSFIASMSQGIRHAPFTTFDFRPKGRTLILSALPGIVHRTCRKEFPVITVLLVSICQRSLSQI